jgi:hypothetical protein
MSTRLPAPTSISLPPELAVSLTDLVRHIDSGEERALPFQRRVFEFIDEIIQAEMPTFDMERLRSAVLKIDDSCLIEQTAIKAGFLMGFEACRQLAQNPIAPAALPTAIEDDDDDDVAEYHSPRTMPALLARAARRLQLARAFIAQDGVVVEMPVPLNGSEPGDLHGALTDIMDEAHIALVAARELLKVTARGDR